MDEPLSNLDAALRAQMRTELKRIHAQFPVTTVYVTHDQVEAMTMADRVALMRGGRLQQVVTPEEIYDRPANTFVASFIGTPRINMLDGQLHLDGDVVRIGFLGCFVTIEGALAARLRERPPGSVKIGFRPEEIGLASGDGGPFPVAKGRVELVEPLGSETHVVVLVEGESLTCKLPAHARVAAGDAVALELNTSQMKLFDGENGGRLD
jgi:multiple sugar transport system ATP-binding protein